MYSALSRLYFLQLTAVIAVALSMNYPGLDIFLACMYLVVIGWESRSVCSTLNGIKKWRVGFYWQMPSFLLISMAFFLPTDYMDQVNYIMFTLQLWQTPMLPLLSLLPLNSVAGLKFLYAVLPFFLLCWYSLPANKIR
ncbi:MAG TPA: hypothetical protein GX404_03240 [Syntrophomonadaceae bacterium]|nr:hypothetical protein [Syntrophomonadaceae bacterium]